MPLATNIRQCKSTGQSIDLFYSDTHENLPVDSVDETLLMVPGLNNVNFAFDDEFVHLLQAKLLSQKNKRLRVIRIDNRDAGKSKHFDHLGQPWLYAISGFAPSSICPTPHYTLTDMAEDAWALLDHLKIETVHLWSHSMGGGITSEMLLLKPNRVASFAPTMTSTFAGDLPGPALRTRLNFLKAPKSDSFEDMLDFKMNWYMENSLPPDAEQHDPKIREYLKAHHSKVINHTAYNRGAFRQVNAIQHTRPREPLLRDFVRNHERSKDLRVFILHGNLDKILPIEHGYRLRDIFAEQPAAADGSKKVQQNSNDGEDEVDANSNAKPKHPMKFHVQKGMGHFLEPRFWNDISDAYVDHVF